MTVPLRRRPPRLVTCSLALCTAAALVACGAEPTPPIDVLGRVAFVSGFDIPLAGVLVHVQGQTRTTDADGRFAIEGVRPPYTLVLGAGGTQPWVHAYEGLTTPTPTLSPHAVITAFLSPTGYRRATIEGSLSNPLIAGRRIELCAVGLGGVRAYGCDTILANDQSYEVIVGWRDASSVTVRLYAIQYQVDGDGRPTAVLSSGWVDRLVTDGATLTQAVPSGVAPASVALQGTILAGGGQVPAVLVRARTEGVYVLPVYEGGATGGVLDLQAPLYADAELMVATYATFPTTGGVAFTWAAVDPTQPFTLTVPAPPQLLEPVDGATGIGAGTVFRALGGPAGARTFSWLPDQGQAGPAVALTTMRDEARLPDVGAVGQSLPADGQYTWSAAVVAAPDLATAAAFPAIGVQWFLGTGIGLTGTGAVALSDERAFVLGAP